MSRPVRYVFLAPMLGYGGGEWHSVSLVTGMDPTQAECVGVLVAPGAPVHEDLLRAMADKAPVFLAMPSAGDHDRWLRDGLIQGRFRDLATGLKVLCRHADVLISWWIEPLDLSMLEEPIPAVLIAHGEGCVTTPLVGYTHGVAVSQGAMNMFNHRPNRDQIDARVILNGPMPSKYLPSEDRAAQRARWGVTDDQKVILFNGRQDAQKAPEMGIMALLGLPDNYVTVYHSNGHLIEWLRGAAEYYKVVHRVRIFPAEPNVGDQLAGADVLFVPSAYETNCMALLEAFCAGVPCVATRVGAIPELEAESGLKLVESVTHRGPVPELAAATQAAVNGSLDTAAIRAYALEHWSAANMYRQWENFIQTAATRRDTPILLGGRQQRPLRVAIVTPGLCVGGAEQWIAGMCLWLDPERACTVKVFVTIPGLIHQEAAGWIPRHVEIVETSTIPDDGSFDVLVSWGLVNLIELTAHISCPLIDVQHLVKPDEWWQQRAKTSTVAHALLGTHLVAVHAVALDNFPAHARGQVTIIANGADPGRVYPLTTREKVRQQLGIAENAKVVVYIGRLAPEKNVQALVDAAAYLDDSWRVVIIGPPGEALERLGPNVLVLPAKSHIGSWLGMSDVLCHPADTESHCYTINEAWLAGLPVVSCAYPVNRSFESQHGPMMWLVPVRPEPAVLAKAIQTAYVERHDPRVRRAQAVAQTEYVAPVSGRRWTDFLESVIAHPAH